METRWHVLHVKPRCEKKMAEYGVRRGCPLYLPLRTETKIYQRRKVTVAKPVFPGYVFVEFAPDQRAQLLKSNQIVRILEVADQNRLLHELDQIRKALAADPTLGACQAVMQGSRARIAGGPFQGLEGVVTLVRGQTRVLLNVEMIGQAVALDVDASLLEICG
jgi:transcription antitermination factor NusG